MEQVKKRSKKGIIIVASTIAAFFVVVFVIGMVLDAVFQEQTKRDSEKVYYAIDIVCLKNKDYAKMTDKGLVVADLKFLEDQLSYELQFDVDVVVNNVPSTINSNLIVFKGNYNNSGYYSLTSYTYYHGTYNWKSHSMTINPKDFTSYIS